MYLNELKAMIKSKQHMQTAAGIESITSQLMLGATADQKNECV